MPAHSDELRLAYLRYITEARRILAAMGVKDTNLKIAYCLQADQRPWTISAMSDATGLTRVTVRAAFQGYANRGLVAKTTKGYSITEAGAERVRARFDEFFRRVDEPLFRFHRLLAREFPGLDG